MAFTQNFNYCMEQKNYSAYKFAQIIGASNQGVLNWQTGVSIPYPKTKQKIANHFGISVAELDGDELPVLPEKKESVPDPKIEGVKKPPPQRARAIQISRRPVFSLCCHCRRKSWSGL